MNSEVEVDEIDTEFDDDDEDLEMSSDDDDVSDDDGSTDNVGDVSVEINVEELIADIEGYDAADAARRKEIRRRLEELAEERALDDTFAFDLNDDS